MGNDMPETAAQLPAECDPRHRNQARGAAPDAPDESAIHRLPAALDWFPIDFDCEIIDHKLCKP